LQRDALRIFYTTLREQVPESEMAEIWWVFISSLNFEFCSKASSVAFRILVRLLKDKTLVTVRTFPGVNVEGFAINLRL